MRPDRSASSAFMYSEGRESTITACQKLCLAELNTNTRWPARLSMQNAALNRRAPRKFVWCNSFVWESLRKLLQVSSHKSTPTFLLTYGRPTKVCFRTFFTSRVHLLGAAAARDVWFPSAGSALRLRLQVRSCLPKNARAPPVAGAAARASCIR
jgi:hypothetical protein